MTSHAGYGISDCRGEFPGASKWTYLDVAGRGILPLRTRRALDSYLDMRMEDGGDKAAMFRTVESARSRFARLIGAEPDEIAITKNISEGLNAIACAYPWKKGDRVLVCAEREHPNNIYLWHNLARRHGIEVRFVASEAGRVPTDAMIAAIDERTRIVSASSTTFLPGFRTDLDAIGAACRERDILLLVDGAQSAGVMHHDVRKTAIDAFAVSTQKGLLGLYGMGFLYCRRAWAERLEPVYLARFGVDLGDAHEADGGTDQYDLMPGARRFDLGNHNFAAAAAVDVSIELLEQIGIPVIEQHVLGLALSLAEGLADLGLPIWGLPAGPHLANLVTVGGPTGDFTALAGLYQHLSDNGVKLAVRRGMLRFSFHLYNNQDDVSRVLALTRDWLRSNSAAANVASATV
jgi:cysteine desulfurase / selenocysteine lyase